MLYHPAVGSLIVCGVLYDLAVLAGVRMAVAVGDVVGLVLAAAGVNGARRETT